MAENPPASDIGQPAEQSEAENSDSNADQQGSTADTRMRRSNVNEMAPVGMGKKMKMFCGTHLNGIVAVIVPFLFMPILVPFPSEKWQWCAYTLCVMAAYWVFECIPLPVTSFLPIIVFPLTDIMSTRETCQAYINDTVIMFLGSIMLAASVEQSGLHKRIALYSIKIIGYSHIKMLFAVSNVTMFISMWITNTAVATMMVPIVFALLKVYENQKLYKIYDIDEKTGERQATHVTSCYFCCITYAATIGGIGTLVGTATNLVFKGLFTAAYPLAPEYISFPLYSAFAVPYMIVCNMCMFLYLAVFYMGLFRPNSASAKAIRINAAGMEAAKRQVASDIAALGPMSCHEAVVLSLFGLAILMFFSRSPQVFAGYIDRIVAALDIKNKRFILDSAAATLVIFLMVLFPSKSSFFKNFKAKYADELPKGRIRSSLDWDVMNLNLPYSFSFLLGGGFALSTAAGKKYSDLNGQIGKLLEKLVGLPNALVLFIIVFVTIIITNFASNVAVCNVITPIAMQLAMKLQVHPLWYCVASGVSASFAFMIPVGTPGNLIVQSAAKVPTPHMIIAGLGPTITTTLLTWFFMYLYAPIIWPALKDSSMAWIIGK